MTTCKQHTHHYWFVNDGYTTDRGWGSIQSLREHVGEQHLAQDEYDWSDAELEEAHHAHHVHDHKPAAPEKKDVPVTVIDKLPPVVVTGLKVDDLVTFTQVGRVISVFPRSLTIKVKTDNSVGYGSSDVAYTVYNGTVTKVDEPKPFVPVAGTVYTSNDVDRYIALVNGNMLCVSDTWGDEEYFITTVANFDRLPKGLKPVDE